MYRTNDVDEGEMETKLQEVLNETPNETTPQGEEDAESPDSGDLYLDIPRVNNRTDDGILPQDQLEPLVFPSEREKKDGKFRKGGVVLLILLLFIALGGLTYMVLDLKVQLRDSHDSRAKEKDESKIYREAWGIKEIELEKKWKDDVAALKKELKEKDEKINRLNTVSAEELTKLNSQIHDFQEILRSIIYEAGHFKSSENSEEIGFVAYLALRSTAVSGSIEVLQTLQSALSNKLVWNDFEILYIFQNAASNKNGQVMKYLFEIFKNNFPTYVEPFQPHKYTRMYQVLEILVQESIKLENDILIDNVMEMYGKTIIGYERYLGTYDGNPFYHRHCGLFHTVIEHFLEKENIAHLKLIQDLEEGIISKQCTHNEKVANENQIH